MIFAVFQANLESICFSTCIRLSSLFDFPNCKIWELDVHFFFKFFWFVLNLLRPHRGIKMSLGRWLWGGCPLWSLPLSGLQLFRDAQCPRSRPWAGFLHYGETDTAAGGTTAAHGVGGHFTVVPPGAGEQSRCARTAGPSP